MALHPSSHSPQPFATGQDGPARAPWAGTADLDAPTVASVPPLPEPPAPREAGHPLGPLPAGYGPAIWSPAAQGRSAQAPPRAGGAPGPGGPRDPALEPTSLGGDAATIAGLSYLGWWFTGLLIYFSERQNRFVRFHALQSTIFTGGLTIFAIFAYIIPSLLNDAYLATHNHVFATLAIGIALLMFSLVFIAWLTPLIAAWKGHWLRIPYVAPYAERYTAPLAEDAERPSGV
ncbi:MAG TPA: hypothetical protein VGR57_15100 [Ktedonobacterales bacterium]|nr:hypothetical protein [Ktedonobacterales bacterium]